MPNSKPHRVIFAGFVEGLWPTIAIAVLLFLGWFLLASCESDREIMASGIFDRVEYLQGNFGASARTIVTMEGGTTCVLPHCVSVPFPRGTKIVIVKTTYGVEIRRGRAEEGG